MKFPENNRIEAMKFSYNGSFVVCGTVDGKYINLFLIIFLIIFRLILIYKNLYSPKRKTGERVDTSLIIFLFKHIANNLILFANIKFYF